MSKEKVKINLPPEYHWLLDEPGPNVLTEALKLYGVKEVPGDGDNPVIIGWADEVRDRLGISYSKDSTPWCGLFMAVVARRSGFEPPYLCIRAKEWAKFGSYSKVPKFLDVLVFDRKGGGHVGLYVGEDETHFHVLGGNQRDSVSIVRIDKTRELIARRWPWKTKQPSNIRIVKLTSSGIISNDEQ